MKRLLWTIPFIFLLQIPLQAQTKIGIKVAPSFIINRIKNVPDTIDLTINTLGFRPVIGLLVDMPISDQYFFQIGANYVSKPVKFEYKSNDQSTKAKKYTLQYLQVPFSLKMYTNEIALDKRIYAQVGTQMDIQLYKDDENPQVELIDKFTAVSFTLYLGAGLEFQLGTHTALLAGISYNRGLSNLAEKDFLSNTLILKNDLLSFDVGIKF